MRNTLRLAVSLAATLAVGACSDAGAPTSPAVAAPSAAVIARGGDRLATFEWEGSTPTLYIQNLDGTDRKRVHFDHVSGHVLGNYSSQQLPVTDESIRRFVKMKWSPDGRFLAVILAPSTEALQVVLVTADGLALRTVSPNSQYIWGDVEWSPDSRRIAYIMATGPYGMLPDIFMTELGRDLVTRVTTGARLSGYDVLRFDATGEHILFTKRLGWADDGLNSREQLASVDLATLTATYGDTVIGEPQGFPRDGSWGLFVRWSATARGQRELFKRSADGSQETILATGDLGGATVLEGDQEAIVSVWDEFGGETFFVSGLDTPNDVRAKIPTSASTTWAALWRAP